MRKFVKKLVMAATTAERIDKKSGDPQVPEDLVKEVIDGIPVFYKGYRDVLANTKKLDDIMADGLFQAMLKMWLSNLFFNQLGTQYWVFSGEVGSHVSHRNNMAHDIVILDKIALPASSITNKYADVPAKVVLEIDTEVEYGQDLSVETYIHRKTQNTLDFGTEKVIWIFTASRKIMVAAPGQDWITSDWDKTIEVMNGVAFNVAQYLQEQGIVLDGPDSDL
jgi:hypothetical protein